MVIDELLVRYVEALVYQVSPRTWRPEQSARMVAMKAASDNAGERDRRTATGLATTNPSGSDHEGTVGNCRGAAAV